MKISPGLDYHGAFRVTMPPPLSCCISGVSKALGIEYHIHCSGRPQSSGKVEKANDMIKRHLHNLTQEIQDNWIKVLPIALMRAQTAPPQKRGTVPL